MRLVACIVTAVLVHLLLGWQWSIGGGVLAGVLFKRGAWWKGGLAVGVGWIVLIVYNLAVAYEPVTEMHRVVAGVLGGGIPNWSVPLLSTVSGFLLGLCGGLLGSSIGAMTARDRHKSGPEQDHQSETQ